MPVSKQQTTEENGWKLGITKWEMDLMENISFLDNEDEEADAERLCSRFPGIDLEIDLDNQFTKLQTDRPHGAELLRLRFKQKTKKGTNSVVVFLSLQTDYDKRGCKLQLTEVRKHRDVQTSLCVNPANGYSVKEQL